MSKVPTIEELRHLRDACNKMIETHEYVLEQLGFEGGWKGRSQMTANDLVGYINRKIGELS